MRLRMNVARILALCILGAVTPANGRAAETVVKKVLNARDAGRDLLDPDAWRPWEQGFVRDGDAFVCDNGQESDVQRGVSQRIPLNQTTPEPLIASISSRFTPYTAAMAHAVCPGRTT